MNQQLPALIIIAPLIGAFLVSAAAWINTRYCLPILIASLCVSVISGIGLLAMVLQQQVVVYRLGGWAPPWGILYHVDYLNSPVLILIPVVGLLNAVTCHTHVLRDFPNRIGPFYTLYLLFLTGLLGSLLWIRKMKTPEKS